MDPKFLVNLSGRDYPLYAGVLAEAHERGLLGIETQIIQIPTEENGNVAIVKATVRMKDGRSVEANMYWYRGPLDRGRPIPGGDYRAHAPARSIHRSATL